MVHVYCGPGPGQPIKCISGSQMLKARSYSISYVPKWTWAPKYKVSPPCLNVLKNISAYTGELALMYTQEWKQNH